MASPSSINGENSLSHNESGFKSPTGFWEGCEAESKVGFQLHTPSTWCDRKGSPVSCARGGRTFGGTPGVTAGRTDSSLPLVLHQTQFRRPICQSEAQAMDIWVPGENQGLDFRNLAAASFD